MRLLLCTFLLLFSAASSCQAARGARYVSLCPGTTEVLFALGAGEEVCGVSRYCNYPPEARSKEVIGDFSQPNIEKIVSLAPDIVFCTGLEQSPSVTSLRKLGLKVCVSDPKDLAGVYASILEMGELTGRKEQAAQVVEGMKKTAQETAARVAARGTKHKVFIEIWSDPLMTAGKGSFINELVDIAGGINVCGRTPRPYCRVSEEQVIQSDPDVIIMFSSIPIEKVRDRFCWDGIAAVRNGRVYNDINEDILCRPTPRLVEGLKQLQERILK